MPTAILHKLYHRKLNLSFLNILPVLKRLRNAGFLHRTRIFVQLAQQVRSIKNIFKSVNMLKLTWGNKYLTNLNIYIFPVDTQLQKYNDLRL
jgi:hypothetical protein